MRYLLIFSFLVIIALLPFNSYARINVFTCEPEWKSLAHEIGKDNLRVFSATNAFQDPHYIKARPSLIAKIRKADLLICSGASLESGWLPLLLSQASKKVQPNKVGYLMASDFVKTIQKPKILDRKLGDIHAQGNPHIHLNPYNILLVANEINKRLQNIDPDNAKNYQKNYDDFVFRWKESIIKWEKKALKLQGIKVLPHHKSFSYLFNWLNINEVATLESKPGIAPTSGHLKDLLNLVRREQVQFIILSVYQAQDASNWISKKTGLKKLILPYTVGGNKQSNDLFSLFDNSIDLMLNAI